MSKPPPRYIERVNIQHRKRIPGCTIRPDGGGGKLSGADINLGLLLVCRQIYQEAVLKPFSEIPFYFIVRWTDKGRPGLEGFAEDLAPLQLKAFKWLRIILEHVYFGRNNDPSRSVGFGRVPEKKAKRKFTGLKDLEIVLNPQFWAEEEAHIYCQHLDKYLVHDRDSYYSQSMGWLQVLLDLRLNSLRVMVEAEICEMGRGEKRSLFPTIFSKGQTDTTRKWLRKTELDLRFDEDVVRVDEPVLFGVKQDDDAIRIPPWSTDEALETARVERARNVKIRRLENEALQDDQEDRIRTGHLPIWTLEEMERMAESARYGENKISAPARLVIRASVMPPYIRFD